MLAAARNGDEKAFMALVSPLTPSLQRIAGRFSRNTADADDICQESLLKAYLKLDQFSGKQDLGTHEFHSWLMKITANSAIDFIRRKHVNRLVPLDECQHVPIKPYEAGVGGWGENPEKTYIRGEERGVIVEAIASLPPELRRVCLLRNVMEFSTKEVAARLGISTTAVRLRLFRAHGRLRKSLGGAFSKRGIPACNEDRVARPANSRRNRSARKQSARSTNVAYVLVRYSAPENYACGD
jgi:RNA polymerase sigma-70 factor, ECF subfamily